MKFTYTTEGTCARLIEIELADDDSIREIRFIGGCAGNTQGVAALTAGMDVNEVVRRLRGIRCRNGTSCPDQLARALEAMVLKKAS